MNKTKSQDTQKVDVSLEDHPNKLKDDDNILPSDIHKVIDGQIVPTRAPSEVGRDISPGSPSK